MMAKQPGARYQTAGEVADVLGKWLAAHSLRAQGAGGMYFRPANAPAPPPRRSATKPPGKPECSDDTVSDKNRVTVVQPRRGSSAKLPTVQKTWRTAAGLVAFEQAARWIIERDQGRPEPQWNWEQERLERQVEQEESSGRQADRSTKQDADCRTD